MEENRVTLSSIREALEARDPDLVQLVVRLANESLPYADVEGKPYREGAPTFQSFLAEMRTSKIRKLPKADQEHWRKEKIAALEASNAEIPLSDRLKLHEVLLELWKRDDVFARCSLIEILADIPLSYGPWRAIKRIFKEAEVRNDTEIYGLLAARFDLALAGAGNCEIPQGTLQYLCRRAWRYLRRVGQTLPACYADVASDFLTPYPEELQWRLPQTWIANHIFYHEKGDYNRNRFTSTPNTLQKYRAFSELWQRSPRPLFSLLERANSDTVRQFAIGGIKADFRALLREVEPEWVVRLISVGSSVVDDFAVWILQNVPKFEQSAFRDLGVHEAVLKLLTSSSHNAQKFAAEYARTHARDMDLDQLVSLANSGSAVVRELTKHLILERDPRKDIGLAVWGRLLELDHALGWAQTSLRKHFGAKELTPEWFRDRLLATNAYGAFQFLSKDLLRLHPAKKLGIPYFHELIEKAEPFAQGQDLVSFSLEQLESIGPKGLETSILCRRLVDPRTTHRVRAWVESGLIEPTGFGSDFLKVIAYHPTWESDPAVVDFKKSNPAFHDLRFNEELADAILGWLRDVRKFSPSDLGFDWLMELVKRSESRYHEFAVDTMIRAFLPADFAPKEEAAPAAKAESEVEITVDLQGQSFLFTGKLATMTRSEAKNKVTAAGGANASGVTQKLDFLVIGDEGSPLYGGGRKGSKQLKGEALIADGAPMKIISETAFLQMLSGEQREFSDDAVQEGCKRLWEMMTEPGREDDPLAMFALQYFRRHHPDICLVETDRPVDPGAEIPPEFLTFEQVKPLFSDERKSLRDYALEIAHWEFASWNPPIEGILDLCEAVYPTVREFVAKALTADDAPEHKRYRINPDILTPAAVYSFCESNDEDTRALGMVLIDNHPRLRLPEELFRLTESPDRNVRAFVVRAFWSFYRERGTTEGWKPVLPTQPTTGKKAKKDAEISSDAIGTGAPPRPENPPANIASLQSLLRRALFELPPGRPEKSREERLSATLRPLPARKAKLYLIETMRDLGMEEREFAEFVLPLFREFMGSRGKSEFEACLVAVTRLERRWELKEAAA